MKGAARVAVQEHGNPLDDGVHDLFAKRHDNVAGKRKGLDSLRRQEAVDEAAQSP